MSKRPPPLAPLKGAGGLKKPKFISKKERERLKQEKPAPTPLPPPSKPQPKSQPKPVEPAPVAQPRSKFNFDWDEADDTSGDVEFLVDTTPLVATSLPPSKHWSEKALTEMTERDWRIFNEDHSIVTRGAGAIAHPLRLWDEARFAAPVARELQSLGFSEPTPVQRATIPVAMAHRDVVGVAATGSGKTLAFVLPIVQYLQGIDEHFVTVEHRRPHNRNKTLALVLAPTRELALQIAGEATRLTKPLGLRVETVIGGHDLDLTAALVAKHGVDIVVATPGRLVDCLERKLIGLDHCYYLVLDEADRMIDMGFEQLMEAIMTRLPTERHLNDTIDLRIFHLTKRQTLMFTATLLPPIERLSRAYLSDPIYITVGSVGAANTNIDQHFEMFDAASTTDDGKLEPTRYNRLVQLLKKHRHHHREWLVVVFADYKHVCDQLGTQLALSGVANVVIHGSKTQAAREELLAQFRNHHARVLVATDVAARGIDIPNVTMVVNYEMPKKFDEYIHRVGRTGRAGQLGVAQSFVDDSDAVVFGDLRRYMHKSSMKVPEWVTSFEGRQIVD